MPDVAMPRLSDSMEEGTILKWLKSDGDEVAKGEELVEIETDKATMTYEADADGTLEVVAEEGATLAIGEVIARIGEGGGSSQESSADGGAEQEAAASDDGGEDSGGGTATKTEEEAPDGEEAGEGEADEVDEPAEQPAASANGGSGDGDSGGPAQAQAERAPSTDG